MAASHGRLYIADLLIKRGADINAKDSDGATPLFRSISYGDMDMVKFLIANGADVNVHNEGEFGKTPLHEAVFCWCKPMVQLLIDNGANLNSTNDTGETPLALSMNLENRKMAKLLDAAGADSTIHQAAYIGDLGKIRSFIESNNDVNTKDDNDRTLLHIASEGGYKDIVKLLITNSSNVNAKDVYNVPPLLEATWGSHMHYKSSRIIRFHP